MTHVTGAVGPGVADPDGLGEVMAAAGVPGVVPRASTASTGRRSAAVIARSLFQLTKPRIIELLLVTTLPTMLLAARGLPSARLIVVTLIGGALAAGSANTLNCYIDRDIDAIMRRTSRRPLVARGASATIKPGEALASGIVLGACATLLLGLLANWLSAVLADGAILFYVFVYTLGLKRRTASNIVIGGAAGCFPVLVGWAAVTGRVSIWAGVLFAVIFFWTPPHFWALAMKFRDDYAAASVPMLPVVATPAVVARKILGYSYVMVAATLALAPYSGWIYGCCALGLGGWFLAEAHRLRGRIAVFDQAQSADETGLRPVSSDGSAPAPMRLFHLSIAYLTLLFAVVAVTAVLYPLGRW
ncbi:MAG TPA: heme o synthase [Streptosporangiaceae bacterium]|nr:heme o synthase [Streptosporangiaceae bacterium]